MNRADLANTIVSGAQQASAQLHRAAALLDDDDTVSPSLGEYNHPSSCRLTALRIRGLVVELTSVVAQLSEHAGMLEAFSHMPPAIDEEPSP